MPETNSIQFRHCSRTQLCDAIGAEMLFQLEEFLISNEIPNKYPIGWLLGYSKITSEDGKRFRISVEDILESLKQDGCDIVFAFIEWEESENWPVQREKNIEIFRSLGWTVSPPFAALHNRAEPIEDDKPDLAVS